MGRVPTPWKRIYLGRYRRNQTREVDTIEGGPGNGTVRTNDAESLKAKDLVDCGPGSDTIYYNEGLDKVEELRGEEPAPTQ